MSDGDGGGGGHIDAIWNLGRTDRWPSVKHYYGDAARGLMLGAAALLLVASPLYGNNLRAEFPFEVLGALGIAALAAFTSPRDRWASIGDSVATGVGVFVYATWAMYDYSDINSIAFVLRIAIAIIFLFAFYFSLKTVRAFTAHEIGKRDSVDDFETDVVKRRDEELEWENMAVRPDAER